MKWLFLSFNRKSEQKLNPSVSKAEVTSQRQSEKFTYLSIFNILYEYMEGQISQ